MYNVHASVVMSESSFATDCNVHKAYLLSDECLVLSIKQSKIMRSDKELYQARLSG